MKPSRKLTGNLTRKATTAIAAIAVLVALIGFGSNQNRPLFADPSLPQNVSANPGSRLIPGSGDGTAGGPALPAVSAALGTILLEDNFNRVASPTVGLPSGISDATPWFELDTPPGISVSIGNTSPPTDGKLFFDATSNTANVKRPMVNHSFDRVSDGTLQFDFDFDWERIGTDTGYEVWMQLGDGQLMQDPSSNQNIGVGVNLRWGQRDFHEQFAARQNSGVLITNMSVISGLDSVSVIVDMVNKTYSVFINGTAVDDLVFDDSANVMELDTVRFFTHNIVTNDFTGRTFDNVVVSTDATSANTPPVADAGPDQNLQVGDTVTLDGSASSDADGDTLTFLWEITSAPAGSTATLTNPTTSGPTFVPNVAGSYDVELVVNDGTDDSAPDTVTITAAVGNTPPVAAPAPTRAYRLVIP